ncbi:MAG: transcription-repair coupling factor, partial [Oscillospiraceae bacterium]|nr:transcription-repair coupling factor [Oscillospiraceae bacterium]
MKGNLTEVSHVKILSEAILENKNLSPLPDAVEGGRLPALVSGLGPVHRANLGAALAEKTGRPLWVVAPDDTAAEAMAGDLRCFLGQEVSVLAGREFSFYDMESVSRQGEQRRLKLLDKLAAGRTGPVVCTVGALLQRTIPPSALIRACFSVKTGDCLPMEDGVDRLLRLGYRPAEQVEGPGQFARRGGIL